MNKKGKSGGFGKVLLVLLLIYLGLGLYTYFVSACPTKNLPQCLLLGPLEFFGISPPLSPRYYGCQVSHLVS
jgi:hypothetical protein